MNLLRIEFCEIFIRLPPNFQLFFPELVKVIV